MTAATKATTKLLLPSLCRANQAILTQKKQLLDAIQFKYGATQCSQLFSQSCSIVHASIGQHYRHSMDHLALPLQAASDCSMKGEGATECSNLQYDIRTRGGNSESDINEARKRIDSLLALVENIESTGTSAFQDLEHDVSKKPILASFFLSADPHEYEFDSTIGREMGFAVHHAIHHMAMIRIIVEQSIGLDVNEIPADFGKAPSTIQFEKT